MRLKYTPEAIRDLQSISDYITNVLYNPAAAMRIKKRMLNSCASLKQQPYMGGSVEEKTGYKTELRYLVCEKHLIFYRVVNDEIQVARIINGKMDYIHLLFEEFTD